jgi:phenylacetate-CoA ligase
MGFFSRVMTLDSPLWQRDAVGNIYLACYGLKNFKHLGFRIFLERSQWFSRFESERYQAGCLRRLLRHASRHVPYYTDLLRKNKLTPEDFLSVGDLRKLPILTKKIVLDNYDKLQSRAFRPEQLYQAKTSGTTGTPMVFNRELSYRFIDFLFFFRMLSFLRLGRYGRQIHFWLRPFIAVGLRKKFIYHACFKQLMISPVREGATGWDERFVWIRKFRPDLVLGSSSFIYDLASYCEAHHVEDIGLKGVLCCSENLPAYQRDFMEKQFGCKVFDYYTTQERVISAYECFKKDGMHLDMERGIAEIVDDSGAPLESGQRGRIVATGLHSLAMPLIRYETGDVGCISYRPCSCGRNQALVTSLEGRAGDVIRYRDRSVSASALGHVPCKIGHIKECQFVQETDEQVTVNIVASGHFSESDAQALIRCMRGLLDERLEVKIRQVAHIPRINDGKFRLVVSLPRPVDGS